MKLMICLVALLSFISLVSLTMSDSQDITFTADVGQYISIVVNYNSVQFGSLTSGTNDNPAPDQLNGIYNSTISTNANYSLIVNSTNWDSGIGTFNADKMSMDWNTDSSLLNNIVSVTLSTSPVYIHNNTDMMTTTEYHGFWLDIPVGQTAGSYVATATLTYANV